MTRARRASSHPAALRAKRSLVRSRKGLGYADAEALPDQCEGKPVAVNS